MKSERYKNWLYNYTEKIHGFSDESLLYEKDSEDRTNSLLLSFFHSYIAGISNSTYYDEDGFDHYIIKLKDKVFDIYTILGQGAVTYICECENNEKAIVID